MKMSDKFKLPLTEQRVDARIGCAWSIGGKAEYITHAINNHDKLVESLREVIDLSKSPREHKEARERASKLLADLENGNA